MSLLNKLWVRLTLAFTLVILMAVGAIAVLINQTTDIGFRQYVTHSGMRASGSGVQQLAAFYEQQGSWEGVESLLGQGIVLDRPGGLPMPGMRDLRLDVLLTDAHGKVIYDSADRATGKRLSNREKSRAVAINSVDGAQVIGYLLLASSDAPDWLGTLEQQFLGRVQRVLLITGALAVGLGLIASALLSHSLVAPLQRLATAARAVAGGDLGQQVRVEGSTEIADVGRAFNEMTTALEESESLRRNMVADVAHELRTPLSVLQGNLRAILDGVYPLEKQEMALLYDETRLLGRLVNDLHELAQAEAGQLSIHPYPTDVIHVVRTTVTNFEPAAEDKSIRLTATLPPALPPVLVDPDRLAQVLRNLLTNALRHTPEGQPITVAASLIDGAVEIAVTDRGEGIATQDLPYVFDRFYRAERSRSRTEGGAGLGLAIVKAIVEAHRGQVSATSDGPGQGSTFRVRLPLA
ncbi:MAG: sensor histidine kinase [Chloroflexota bacterium]